MEPRKESKPRAKKPRRRSPKGPRIRRWSPDSRPWSEKAKANILATPEEVAEVLNVAPSWVRRNASKLPGHVRLGRYHRFRLHQVIALGQDGAGEKGGR